MNDISEILRMLLDKTSNPHKVGPVFLEMLNSDDKLKADYKTWCNAHGYNIKNGFQEFLEEITDANSIWDTLEEYGNDI